MRRSFVTALALIASVVVLAHEDEEDKVRIAGPRAQYPVFESLMNVWAFSDPDWGAQYQSTSGSSAATRLATNSCDIAVPDLVPDASVLDTAPDMMMFPLWAQPLVPVFNLPEFSGINLVFSASVIARIFRGNLTHWNDPELAALNPALTFPNEPISKVLVSRGALTDAITLFLSEVDEEWRQTIGRNRNLDWTSVGPHFAVYSTPSNLAYGVHTTPFSFALQQFSVAVSIGLQYGKMRNRAGNVIEPNTRSVTFAVLESSNRDLQFDAKGLDSMNSWATEAWPIPLWSYLLVRREGYRRSCPVKADAIKFAKWIYESEVAATVAAESGYVVLPKMLNDLFGVSIALEKDVLCEGAPVLGTTTVADIQAISSNAVQKAVTAMVSAYVETADRTINTYEVTVVNGDVAIQMVKDDAVDLAVIVTDALPRTTLMEVIGDGSNLRFIGLWSYSIVPVHSLSLPDGAELKLDLNTLARIWTGDISRWDHEDILRANPDLANANVLKGNITRVVVTSGPRETERAVIQFMNRAAPSAFPLDSTLALSAPSFVELPWFATKLQPAITVDTEGEIPDTVSFNPGSISFMLSAETRLGLEGRSTKVITLLRNGKAVYPTAQARRACESDSWNEKYMVFDLPSSKNDSCYPLSNYAYALIKVESGGNCERIKKSLSFLKQLILNAYDVSQRFELDWATGYFRQLGLETLDGAICNGDTVLVVLPEHHKVPQVAHVASIAVSGFLAILALISMVLTLAFRKRRVIKAYSPLFMSITLLGILLLATAAPMMTAATPTEDNCTMSVWFGVTGLYLTFVPLFAKIWRIYRIFFRAEMQVVRLPDWKLLIYITIPFLGLVGIMSIIEHTDPLRPFSHTMEASPRDIYFEYCGTGTAGLVLLSLIGLFMLMVIVFGAVMAYSTRGVVQ